MCHTTTQLPSNDRPTTNTCINNQRTTQVLELQRKISVAQRDRDLGLVADLRYNALPEVQHRLEQVRTQSSMRFGTSGQSACSWLGRG